jgi:hypothetical protein
MMTLGCRLATTIVSRGQMIYTFLLSSFGSDSSRSMEPSRREEFWMEKTNLVEDA